MRAPVPFLSTSIETDLMMVILLAPLWWVTGFSIFSYYGAVFWIFLKFLMQMIRQERPLLVPAVGNWLLFFIFSYLASIIINIPFRPSQRIFSSFNNWLMFFMGYLILLLVYNCDPLAFFKRLLKTCRYLCAFTSILGVVVLILWMKGTVIYTPTLLGDLFPSLMNYPYFRGLLHIMATMPEWLAGEDKLPRLTLYSLAPTSMGGLMVMLLPLAYAYYAGKRKMILEGPAILFFGLMVLVFTLSRSAIYAFVMAIILVFAIQRGFSFIFSLLCLFSGFIASGLFSRLIEWILNLRKSSTTGRLEVVEEALRILFEAPMIKIAVMGSHNRKLRVSVLQTRGS